LLRNRRLVESPSESVSRASPRVHLDDRHRNLDLDYWPRLDDFAREKERERERERYAFSCGRDGWIVRERSRVIATPCRPATMSRAWFGPRSRFCTLLTQKPRSKPT